MARPWRVVANKFKRRRRELALAMVHLLAFTWLAAAPGIMMQSGEIVTVEHPSTKRRFKVTPITPELVDDAQARALAPSASEAIAEVGIIGRFAGVAILVLKAGVATIQQIHYALKTFRQRTCL